MTRTLLVLALLAASAAVAGAQAIDAATWTASALVDYAVTPNIVYSIASGHESKLDVYRFRASKSPSPVVIFIHGGGWITGTKDSVIMQLLPYLQMGWSVVNVEYRLANIALAPAAVVDCRCALRWVVHHAREQNFDVNRIVVTGRSAGGHLALTTGMLPVDSPLDCQCPGPEPLKVAAIINWFGITDVEDLLAGAHRRSYAVAWFGSMVNREQIARQVSPLRLVRPGICPILSIHGDSDPIVPYAQAVRLHRALDAQKTPNQLITIPGGKHGGFNKVDMVRSFAEIRDFLAKHASPR